MAGRSGYRQCLLVVVVVVWSVCGVRAQAVLPAKAKVDDEIGPAERNPIEVSRAAGRLQQVSRALISPFRLL